MKQVLSIIIVNYNTDSFLRNCLASLYAETRDVSFEVWIVDNHSTDTSVTMVRECFPQVNLIINNENTGFATANNQAISLCQGDYILLLNPDTLILNQAVDKMVGFMAANPVLGICGCKVLNPDRTLQLACRRSIPTPGIAFFRLTGLSRLFPKSRMMAKYNLTYMNPDQSHAVDAVSGSVLMIQRKVVDEIGLLDERFFMYGEELDWCFRAQKAGWPVMYYSDAEIIHYKGESSKFNHRQVTLEFYRSMALFHKKHFAHNYNPVINALVYTGIFFKAMISWRSFFCSTKVGSSG